MRNKKIKALVLGVVLFNLGYCSSINALSDIKGHEDEKYIKELVSEGILSGYEDGTFRPDNPITRGEFAKIVNRYFDIKEDTNHNFKDVSDSNWYSKDIGIAYNIGYMNGYPDGTFKPNEFITTQEAMASIARLKNIKAIRSDITFFAEEENGEFIEVTPAQWAQPYFCGLFEKDLIGNVVNINKDITRGEVSRFLTGLKEYKNKPNIDINTQNNQSSQDINIKANWQIIEQDIQSVYENDFNGEQLQSLYTDNKNLYVVDGSKSNYVNITGYDKKTLEKTYTKKIPFQNSTFGKFYQTEKYNFIIFGNDAKIPQDQMGGDTLTIAKYDKEFNLLSKLNVSNHGFGTNIDVDHLNNKLALFVGVTPEDGDEPASYVLEIDIEKMKVINEFDTLDMSGRGKVCYNGDKLVAVTNGFNEMYVFDQNKYDKVDFEITNNYKKVFEFKENEFYRIKDLEVLNGKYVVPVIHSKYDEYGSYERIELVVHNPKDNKTSVIPINKFTDGTVNISELKLVEIDLNKYVLLWEVRGQGSGNYGQGVGYVSIDKNGKIISKEKFIEDITLYELQKPILVGNKIVWTKDMIDRRYIFGVDVD